MKYKAYFHIEEDWSFAEADSFEELRKVLLKQYVPLYGKVVFTVTDELSDVCYSGMIIDRTFYFKTFKYKNL